MPIYRIDNKRVIPIERTTFAQLDMRERDDLQALLKSQIDVISPDTLIVAEEFGEWEGSRRRIDLLGIDKDANLVVIELKRTEDGGHMELQAIRYAAMISSLTFDKMVTHYERYLSNNGIGQEAKSSLLEFLGWDEPDEEQFGQEVRVTLASADFSKELTTAVMWLNDFGLDIRCIRMDLYTHNGEMFLDIQTVIPIPEVADYQVRIREKKQKERESRKYTHDLTKYDVRIAGESFPAQNKRWMMFRLISGVLANGHTPEKITKAVPGQRRLFQILEGELSTEQVYQALMEGDPGGKVPRARRFFSGDDEFFPIEGKTYVLTNQWGSGTLEAAESLKKTFPDLKIEFKPSG